MTEPTEENEMHEVSRLRIDCPHCGSHLRVRTSKTHLPEYRELYLYCINEWKCGYRCKGHVSIDETLVPSHCPNPEVSIRPSNWLLQKLALEAQGQISLGDFKPAKKESKP